MCMRCVHTRHVHVHKYLQVSIRTDACIHVLTDERSTMAHQMHARTHVRTILKNAIAGVRPITHLRKQAPWKNAVRNIKHAKASSTT